MMPSLTPNQDAIRDMFAVEPSDPSRLRIYRVLKVAMMEFAAMMDANADETDVSEALTKIVASMTASVMMTLSGGSRKLANRNGRILLSNVALLLEGKPTFQDRRSWDHVKGGKA